MQQTNSLLELSRNVVNLLPARRAQVSNWIIQLFSVKKNFIGTLFGNKIEIHPLEAASRSAYFLGFYERETSMWCINFFLKNKPKLVFDVGANFGYFSYLAAAYSPTSQVISFEPDPYNFSWLKRNYDLIGKKDFKYEQLAISNSTGEVSFIPSKADEDLNLWSQINFNTKGDKNEIRVPSTSLDEYCSKNNIQSVDLIKMDIEGAEGYAVDGMEQGISEKKYKNVLIEIHPHLLKSGPYSLNSIAQKFLKNGYKAFYFDSSFNSKNLDDKHKDYYNLTWDNSYLVETFPEDHKLSEWEHVLFVV